MERPISIDEAGERFSDVLRDVGNGDTFVVTLAGEPVAKIVPASKKSDRRRRGIAELLDYLETLSMRNSGEWRRDELYER